MDKNKEIKKAVALKYSKDMNAPKIIAKGKGIVAEKIIQAANKEKIDIFKDEQLTSDLMDVGMGDEIPEDLYEAVAEIIYFVHLLDEKEGKDDG